MSYPTRHLVCAALLAAALLATAAVAHAQTPPPAGQLVLDPITGPIRANDVIRVIVAGADKYSGEFRIEADGTCAIPRLGSLPLAGQTPAAAGQRIAERIKALQLLKIPDVTVVIAGRKAREAMVNGAVQTQGRQVLRDGTLLSDVLEAAGIPATADLSRVRIQRGTTEIKVNFKLFRNGLSNDTAHNPPVEDGDRIYVFAAEPNEGTVRILGEVKDPTKTALTITSTTTVAQALQLAGGVTDLANRKGIYVQRGDERLPVNYDSLLKNRPETDFLLKDKDEIHIPRLERRKEFLVAGAVRSAGAYPLTARTTLLQAVATAGGTLEGAKKREVVVRKAMRDGRVVTARYNLDKDFDAAVEIEDGDYIEIPFGGRRGLDFNQLLGTMVGVASLFSFWRR